MHMDRNSLIDYRQFVFVCFSETVFVSSRKRRITFITWVYPAATPTLVNNDGDDDGYDDDDDDNDAAPGDVDAADDCGNEHVDKAAVHFL